MLHGGYSPMRPTTGMGATSGISTVPSSGDTSIQTSDILAGVVSSGQRNVRAFQGNLTAVEPVSPRRPVTPTEMARRSFDQPATLAPIMANTFMCCVVERAATSTEQMAPTYGCDGARNTTEEHRAFHSEWRLCTSHIR